MSFSIPEGSSISRDEVSHSLVLVLEHDLRLYFCLSCVPYLADELSAESALPDMNRASIPHTLEPT